MMNRFSGLFLDDPDSVNDMKSLILIFHISKRKDIDLERRASEHLAASISTSRCSQPPRIGASIGKLLGLVKGWAWYMAAWQKRNGHRGGDDGDERFPARHGGTPSHHPFSWDVNKNHPAIGVYLHDIPWLWKPPYVMIVLRWHSSISSTAWFAWAELFWPMATVPGLQRSSARKWEEHLQEWGRKYLVTSRSNEILLLGRHFQNVFFKNHVATWHSSRCPTGDVSLFIPAQLSSQLVVNMITGDATAGNLVLADFPS